MNRNMQLLVLAGASSWSATALASDYTPLFVLFFELPILVFSVVFLITCFAVPQAGRVLAASGLAICFVVMIWASGVGYMGSAGGLLLVATALNIVGLFVAATKMHDDGPESADGGEQDGRP